MLKFIPLFSLLLLLSFSGEAQNIWIEITNSYPCSFSGDDQEEQSAILSRPASPSILQKVSKIVDVMSLSPNFIVMSSGQTKNARAFPQDTFRYIIYNPIYFQRIKAHTQNDWAITFILAHEMAHHLNNDVNTDRGSIHHYELYADEFAGKALKALGARLSDALAISKIFAKDGNDSHPSRNDRIAAIRRGWERGQKKECKETTSDLTFINNSQKTYFIKLAPATQERTVFLLNGLEQNIQPNSQATFYDISLGSYNYRLHYVVKPGFHEGYSSKQGQVKIVGCKENIETIR